VRGGPIASAGHALRGTLGNAAIRRIEAAWAAGVAADWAFLVVLLVVAYEDGGALAVGVLGAVRLVPAIFAAPFATMLVERYRGDRVLTRINLLRAVGAIVAAVVIGLDLPIEVTYVLAAVVAGAGSLVRPIQSALLPALARTPTELVAANVASSTGEGLGTFLGPLVAGVLVASTGSVPSSLLVAAGFAGAAAALTGVSFEGDADARGGVQADRSSSFRIREVRNVFRRYPGAVLVIGDFLAQAFVRGALTTLIVVASFELLDMGDTGVGLMNAMIGFGGLLGAIVVLGLAGGGGLASVFLVALVGWGVPLVSIGVWPVEALALGALFVTGVSNAVLDVSGFTLIQRGVRNEDRVTVFGVFESTIAIAILLGSALAPALVAILGTRGALVAVGALLPLMAALTWRSIARRTSAGPLTEEIVHLLRTNPLFAPLPLTALDRLAESLEARSFKPGDTIMRKGEPGDHYLLIVDGEVEVSDNGRALSTCGPGEGVGEIALLRRVPRTATVVARTRVEGYAIDAPAFLSAVSGPAAGAAAERIASARLARSREQLVTG
jgi:MFS family permease